ncbi:MAG: divalent-cation tolerance protein CutA [Candidatus Aureabacteria bacterium]|nr:divalent-cation tolerance protein CutA [Candidatus Auribacterota bacterium]
MQKRKHQYCIAHVTVPNAKLAKKIGEGLVKEKLAACVNIVPEISSIYQWKGKIAKDKEILLIIKTTCAMYKKLEQWVLKNHPYEVPEVICYCVEEGNKKYLKWIKETVFGRWVKK